METNSVQSALYSLVQKYVERQSIVLSAMRELRPDIALEDWEITPEERSKLRIEFWRIRKPAVGLWDDNREWEYFVHGGGCRLIHSVTQERIDWDARNLQRFDRSSFVNHLKWRLEQPIEDKAVSIFKAWYEENATSIPKMKPSFGPLHDAVFPMLEELAQLGLLTQQQQYFILIERG
jgi:hypothetical protein